MIPRDTSADVQGGHTTTTPEGIAHAAPGSGRIQPELMTLEQAAAYCAVSPRALWGWAERWHPHPPAKIGKGTVRYSRRAYEGWIAAGCPRIDGWQGVTQDLIRADDLSRELGKDPADLYEQAILGAMPKPYWRRHELVGWVAEFRAPAREGPTMSRDELLPVPPLDPAMLPDALRPWCADVSTRMQCPPDFVAVAAMVVLAAVVGRQVGIRPKQRDNWQVIPNLWGLLIEAARRDEVSGYEGGNPAVTPP